MELRDAQEKFRAAGIALYAISYDDQKVLAEVAETLGIEYSGKSLGKLAERLETKTCSPIQADVHGFWRIGHFPQRLLTVLL